MLVKIQKEHTDKVIELWFQDETRVGQQGRLTRIWGEKGKRQRLLKDMRFEYSYIYGAICPERDIGEAIVLPNANKEGIKQHLEAISQRVPKDRHAVLVMDNAPWHKSLHPPKNITIVYLPPYSPELNPHENIWAYLKNNYLANKVFEDIDHIVSSCCDAWNNLCQEMGRIKTIGTREWATIN